MERKTFKLLAVLAVTIIVIWAVTGIVAICVGYITKRIVQKMDMFNGKKDI